MGSTEEKTEVLSEEQIFEKLNLALKNNQFNKDNFEFALKHLPYKKSDGTLVATHYYPGELVVYQYLWTLKNKVDLENAVKSCFSVILRYYNPICFTNNEDVIRYKHVLAIVSLCIVMAFAIAQQQNIELTQKLSFYKDKLKTSHTTTIEDYFNWEGSLEFALFDKTVIDKKMASFLYHFKKELSLGSVVVYALASLIPSTFVALILLPIFVAWIKLPLPISLGIVGGVALAISLSYIFGKHAFDADRRQQSVLYKRSCYENPDAGTDEYLKMNDMLIQHMIQQVYPNFLEKNNNKSIQVTEESTSSNSTKSEAQAKLPTLGLFKEKIQKDTEQHKTLFPLTTS